MKRTREQLRKALVEAEASNAMLRNTVGEMARLSEKLGEERRRSASLKHALDERDALSKECKRLNGDLMASCKELEAAKIAASKAPTAERGTTYDEIESLRSELNAARAIAKENAAAYWKADAALKAALAESQKWHDIALHHEAEHGMLLGALRVVGAAMKEKP